MKCERDFGKNSGAPLFFARALGKPHRLQKSAQLRRENAGLSEMVSGKELRVRIVKKNGGA